MLDFHCRFCVSECGSVTFPGPLSPRWLLTLTKNLHTLQTKFLHFSSSAKKSVFVSRGRFSRTRFQHLSGTRGALDFIELPSILCEYFASDAATLALFAQHHQTGMVCAVLFGFGFWVLVVCVEKPLCLVPGDLFPMYVGERVKIVAIADTSE
jgi:hypothetical protein